MRYSYDKFLKPLASSDRNIQILDDNGITTYTINPFSILNLQVINNLLQIDIKGGKNIILAFAGHIDAKEALIRIQPLIDHLTLKVPFNISKDVENYVNERLSGFTGGGGSGTQGFQGPGSNSISNALVDDHWYFSDTASGGTFSYESKVYYVPSLSDYTFSLNLIDGSLATSIGTYSSVNYHSIMIWINSNGIEINQYTSPMNGWEWYFNNNFSDIPYAAQKATRIVVGNDTSNYAIFRVDEWLDPTVNSIPVPNYNSLSAAVLHWESGNGTINLGDNVRILFFAAPSSNGIQGPKGDIGNQGWQGNDGWQGSQGWQGSGDQGWQGNNGSQGFQGGNGHQGWQGSIGYQGLQGINGSQGWQGDSGVQGNDGYGFQGDDGVQGFQGSDGYGLQGNNGTQGFQGNNGNQGVQGNDGYQGFQGIDGGQGFQGNEGPQGLTGISDRYQTISYDTFTIPDVGFTVSFTVENQLSYSPNQTIIVTPIDHIDDHFHGYVVSYDKLSGLLISYCTELHNIAGETYSAWMVNLSGAVGAIGPQGSQGTQGNEGIQGNDGVQGWQGNQGIQGFQGNDGIQGFQGNDGIQGFQGNDGSQGFQGSDGSQGFQGNDGSQGFQGNDGLGFTYRGAWDSGTQYYINDVVEFNGSSYVCIADVIGYQPYYTGFWGLIASPGSQGLQGLQGSDGFQGNDGSQGFQGIDGYGFQGSDGSQGFQGIDGLQGFQGVQGNDGNQGFQGNEGTQGLTGISDRYQTISYDSFSVPNIGYTVSFTVETQLSYSPNQAIIVTPTTDINDYFQGNVVSYGKSSGLMVVYCTGLNNIAGEIYTEWIVNLSGAVGSVGPQGSQGLQGGVGIQGWQGIDGYGFQGNDGTQGFQGNDGTQGSQGPIGFQGYQGQGSQGLQGLQGLQGNQGFQGWQGDRGIQGLQGNQGWQGIQGLQGVQGFQGWQGNPGSGLITNPGNYRILTSTGSSSTQSIAQSNLTFDGLTLSVIGDATVSGTTIVSEVVEVMNDSFNATASNLVYDFTTGDIWYHSSVNTNFTVNFTNLPTTNSRTITSTILVNVGSTTYSINGVQIGGVNQTVKWSGGATPSGSINKINVYGFTFLRSGGSWAQVLGQSNNFG